MTENQEIKEAIQIDKSLALVEDKLIGKALTDVVEGEKQIISLSRYGFEHLVAPCAVLAWN